MAGLVPAIQVLLGLMPKTWMPGMKPGMTNDNNAPAQNGLIGK
jgi:hypothetical protein